MAWPAISSRASVSLLRRLQILVREFRADPPPRNGNYLCFSTISSTPASNYIPNPASGSPDFSNASVFDPRSVGEALSLYGNDCKRALEFFKWVESECGFQHTTETYNRMIDILGKNFEFDRSWDLIGSMRENPSSAPNHVTFRIMFKRYVSAHLVKEAIDAYHNRLGDFGLKDETSFSNLIDTMCEHKHVIEAEELFLGAKENEGLKLRDETKIYNMILRGWSKMDWWGKCRDYWEEMDRRRVRKDLHSYSIYMDIHCRSRKPWKAVQLYKELKRKRFRLDAVVYNTAIRAVGLSEGVDVALYLYREMLETGCQPNVVTFNTIVKLLCESGRFGEAYEILNKMSHMGCPPDVVTFHCIFGCLNKPDEILRLFDRMVESGVRPRTDTYVMLMRKFGKWGFLRPVLSLWNTMEEHGCCRDQHAYNALIDALVDKGMMDMARRYDKEMAEKGLSSKPRVASEQT